MYILQTFVGFYSPFYGIQDDFYAWNPTAINI